MDLEKTLKSYIGELSSNSPTPGGGNVSALCGALSSSLGSMVCSLTIGKKKYAEVEAEMVQIREQLEEYKNRFIELAGKDNQAFDFVMSAFKLPKDTEEEKTARTRKIDEATFGAAEVPAEVIKTCSEVLPLISAVAEKGNQNSVSDAGVASLLISAAAQGAFLNVLINCSSLKHQTEAAELLMKSESLCNEVKSLSSTINDKIIKELRQ